MDIDDLRTISPGGEIGTDICIVGSGPSGLTLVRELAGCGMRILLLESGGLESDPWARGLNAIESVGADRIMDQALVRDRVFGGASSIWTGRVATFDELDFATRPWVAHSGWPISREEVARYLPRTRAHLGTDIDNTTDMQEIVRLIGRAPDRPKVDPAAFRDCFWTSSQDVRIPREAMRFGPRALAERAPDTRCLLNATVTHINTTPDGAAVTSLEVKGRDGQARSIVARTTVLCAGGIENARLLLASNRVVRPGVGNGRDVVGRYLMDHLRGPIGEFAATDGLKLQRLFNSYQVRSAGRSLTLTYGLSLSPDAQKAGGLLNSALWVTPDGRKDDPIEAVRRLARMRGNAGDLLTIVRGSIVLTHGAKRFLIDRRSPTRRFERFFLELITEQAPDPESRVMLSNKTDALGTPLSRIDWRIGAQEGRTVRAAGRLFAAEMRRLRLPAPALFAMMEDAEAPLGLPDVAHPTGTTRMSDDPDNGVVDADCAVHGVEGLYIAGSSVFPTSGHANPTQMIVTLAVRLADHLKQRAVAQKAGAERVYS